jgi:hypothetical protein
MTRIRFALDRASEVRLAVFDVRGRQVRVLAEGLRSPGAQSEVWDLRDTAGRRVDSGVYWVRLATASRAFDRKLVVVR